MSSILTNTQAPLEPFSAQKLWITSVTAQRLSWSKRMLAAVLDVETQILLMGRLEVCYTLSQILKNRLEKLCLIQDFEGVES